jgi:hypothetical protein
MTIEEALLTLRPGAQWTVRGGTYVGIEWQDTTLSQPTEQEVAAQMLLPKPVPVPESVSRRQFRGALRRFGLFEAVDNLRNDPDMDEITRGDLVDFLDSATSIERYHAMILAFAPKLGVTAEQIDQVFILADTL